MPSGSGAKKSRNIGRVVRVINSPIINFSNQNPTCCMLNFAVLILCFGCSNKGGNERKRKEDGKKRKKIIKKRERRLEKAGEKSEFELKGANKTKVSFFNIFYPLYFCLPFFTLVLFAVQ